MSIATKSNVQRKTNATDIGLVKRLRTQTFSMPASTTQKDLLLMAACISLKKNIMTDYD